MVCEAVGPRLHFLERASFMVCNKVFTLRVCIYSEFEHIRQVIADFFPHIKFYPWISDRLSCLINSGTIKPVKCALLTSRSLESRTIHSPFGY